MHIKGEYDEQTWYGRVTIDGRELDPAWSQQVANHSPDGFAWSYAGSGPMQLALGILLETGIGPAEALRLHPFFCNDQIAKLPRGPFTLDIDMIEWLQQARKRAKDEDHAGEHGSDRDAEGERDGRPGEGVGRPH